MSDYDKFAPFYDAAMGDRSDVVRLLKSVMDRHHPQADSLLELGCGTGEIMSSFQDEYALTGVDLSQKMLSLAQRKLPNASFIHSTIAGFDFPDQYDLIICVFDTINHLTAFSDWQRLFRSAKKHLRVNGLFIFDMDTIDRLTSLTRVPGYTQTLPNGSIDISVQAVSPTEVEWHLTIQQPEADGAIQVFEEHVHEASFPLTTIQAELSRYFEILESFDSDHKPPTDRSDRVYFVCR